MGQKTLTFGLLREIEVSTQILKFSWFFSFKFGSSELMRRTVYLLSSINKKPPGCKPHAEKAPLLWADEICYTDSAVGKLRLVVMHLMQWGQGIRPPWLRADGIYLYEHYTRDGKSCQTKSPFMRRGFACAKSQLASLAMTGARVQ